MKSMQVSLVKEVADIMLMGGGSISNSLVLAIINETQVAREEGCESY
jgi:hypothetical protein